MSTYETRIASQKERYQRAGQGQVFQWFDQIETVSEQEQLVAQLEAVDVDQINVLFQRLVIDEGAMKTDNTAPANATVAVDPVIEPFPGVIGRSSDDVLVSNARDKGYEAIRRGLVAALVLAGGQGTRLGFDGPKGMFNIGLPSQRTIFELLAARIRTLAMLASVDGTPCRIPFYIMTSPLNHESTQQYFEQNGFFGLDAESVFFFSQGMLPCLSNDGKIIMETPSQLAMAPDGNGGIYSSLQASGSLARMKKQGTRYLHVFSIDNVLACPADPVFVGYCLSRDADCGNAVVWKSHAHEKVGVLAATRTKHNAKSVGTQDFVDIPKPCIVEYSEISTEMAEQVDDNGRLIFGAGNICNHFYTVDFVDTVILPNFGDMYHVARKKIPYYDDELKQTISPSHENGMKLETFIFDVFPLSERMAVLDVNREEKFAPVKNAPGSSTDSPDTARIMISNLSKKWVVAAGGILIGDTDNGTCEVSPLLSYAGEGLEGLVRGKFIPCPFYLENEK